MDGGAQWVTAHGVAELNTTERFHFTSLSLELSEKAGLKLNIQTTKIMESSPITSQHIGGETMETVKDFIFLGSKITADGDSSHTEWKWRAGKRYFTQMETKKKKQIETQK